MGQGRRCHVRANLQSSQVVESFEAILFFFIVEKKGIWTLGRLTWMIRYCAPSSRLAASARF